MMNLQKINYACNSCKVDIPSIEVFEEQVKETNCDLKQLYHGYSVCPHCKSDDIIITAGDVINREGDGVPMLINAFSLGVSSVKTNSDFRSKLKQIHDANPGSRIAETSSLTKI